MGDVASFDGNVEAHPYAYARPKPVCVDCAFYDFDPRTGATVEIFYADKVAAQLFGACGAGFYWRERGSPEVPSGPFVTCYAAYRQALQGPTAG